MSSSLTLKRFVFNSTSLVKKYFKIERIKARHKKMLIKSFYFHRRLHISNKLLSPLYFPLPFL